MNSESLTATLYDRLGVGVYSIATVVDDFKDRVMSNPVLNPAVDEAHHRVSPAGSSTRLLRWSAGAGPQQQRPRHGRIPPASQDSGEGVDRILGFRAIQKIITIHVQSRSHLGNPS
jgi:hypothetical protein